MPIEESLAIADDVLSALDAAHARGIVHRDLKPDDVFLARREGRVVTKLLDFGISKTIGDETLSLTKTGMVVGTPFYLAPEQARGEDVDQRIDVWAMGVLLYEMLTGVTPFHAENYNKLILRILTTRPEPPTRRRPALAPIVEAATPGSLFGSQVPENIEPLALTVQTGARRRRERPARPVPNVGHRQLCTVRPRRPRKTMTYTTESDPAAISARCTRTTTSMGMRREP